MTPDEIQALREKHQDATWWDNPGCSCCEYVEVPGCADSCQSAYFGYPCDVIEVLDAYEELLAKYEALLAKHGEKL